MFAVGGFGARGGFGKRPALLVIDVNWAFCGERPEPILDSIKRWCNSCGEESWVALEYVKSLIEAARSKGLPVIYTTGERRPDNWDAGSWRWKSTRADETGGAVHDDIDGNEIVAMIAPGPRDIMIKKQKPSGFFGTNLPSYLTLLSIAVRPATPSACAICTQNMLTSSQHPKSSPTSISCPPTCSICPPAVAAPQRRSGRRPSSGTSPSARHQRGTVLALLL